MTTRDATVRDFLVPDLGEGLEDVTIVEWLVSVGDRVELNQVLCIVETAKAEVEIPSPFAGTVAERRGEPGETLAVGSLFVRIETAAPSRAAVLVGYGVDAEGDRSRRAGRGRDSDESAPGLSPRPLAKPPVRKLAKKLGVDLTDLAPGSGPGGIVTRENVTAAAEAHASERPAPPEGGSFAVRGIRARIAERMTLSRQRIPDATCAVEVQCDRLLDLRGQLQDAAQQSDADVAVTAFALVCRLLVQALQRHQMLNATFVEDGPEIRLHSSVHLGIATATERGLVVPVVRDADRLTTLELSRRIGELAAAARAGTSAPTDLQGSTFTVSNFGALGLDDGIPVINHPEAAILGIGAIKERPVVVDGQVAARPTARLTCAFDHRVCDGADAGAFMATLRELIEAPELALLRA